MYKVRFNLEAGEHFRKWQVKHGDNMSYYTPENHTLQMLNCTLYNNSRIAQKIFDGANKSVCAWVECERLYVFNTTLSNMVYWNHSPIFYNPRKQPNWINSIGDNIDGDTFLELLSDDRKLFALKHL